MRYPRRFDREPRKDDIRVNERIRAREIRVVDADGSQLGVMTPTDAMQHAENRGLDLVEVAPNANPPVCRIMDYGRYKYEQQKKKRASKGKAHAATLKEVKVRPRTDDHDLEFKLRNARRFLMEGDKVKITLMFRGREIVHTELGRQQLDRVKEMLADMATVENPPRMDGRFMSMILVPNREAVAALKRAQDAKAKQEQEQEREQAKQRDGHKEPEPEREPEAEAAAGDETGGAASETSAAGDS